MRFILIPRKAYDFDYFIDNEIFVKAKSKAKREKIKSAALASGYDVKYTNTSVSKNYHYVHFSVDDFWGISFFYSFETFDVPKDSTRIGFWLWWYCINHAKFNTKKLKSLL